uniref:ARM repeat superfamily protein n=1 Tax=Steinernema glaseri TaxID=37863 RepID=A0A1I8AGD7_9BILA
MVMDNTSTSDTAKVDPVLPEFVSTFLKNSSNANDLFLSLLNVITARLPSLVRPREWCDRALKVLGHNVFEFDLNPLSKWCLGSAYIYERGMRAVAEELVASDDEVPESYLQPREWCDRALKVFGHNVFQLDLNLPSRWCLG